VPRPPMTMAAEPVMTAVLFRTDILIPSRGRGYG
jgi:hypothetical protein